MAEQSETDSGIESRLAAALLPQVAKTEAESVETQEVEPSDETPEDDGEDLELEDGKVYRVPKELKAKVSEWKEGSLRHADYTKKTQELADLTRQTQALAETVNLRQAFDKEVEDDKAELAGVNFELKQYKQVDLSSLDEATYRRYKDRIEALKDKADDLKKSISKKGDEFNQKIEDSKFKAVTEAVNYLQKVIPNFGKPTMESANEGAYSVGFSTQELQKVLDPRFVHLAWKAAQFDKLQSGKSAAVASVQKAPPVIKAGSTSTAPKDDAYKQARETMKKNPDSLQAAARVFRMREGK